MRVALSISTIHRPQGLERVLRSLVAQEVEGRRADLTAVVVNNDPNDPEPRAIAERVAAETGLAVEVHDEPRRGVAPPRNRGIGRAAELAELIGFIDDDEEAPPGWLAELLRVKAMCGAEIVTGPVVSRFDEPPPAWVVEGRFFERTPRATGSERSWAFTNNVLFDAGLLGRISPWFHEGFLRLSEDRHFFQRLHRTGARIVWAAEAPVVEYVPPHRATEQWLVQRLRTVGRSVAPIRHDLDGPVAALAECLAKGPVWMAIGSATAVAGIVRGTTTRVRGRAWFAYGVGLLEGALSSSAAGQPPSKGD